MLKIEQDYCSRAIGMSEFNREEEEEERGNENCQDYRSRAIGMSEFNEKEKQRGKRGTKRKQELRSSHFMHKTFQLDVTYQKRMSPGTSRLYELQPDPYDTTQRRAIRICLFTDVKNAVSSKHQLRNKLRSGEIDAAMIRAELVLQLFVVLAAANRAVHQAAHNRLATRSLSAELVYSLSPSRNISDSLVTFGIADTSKNVLVCIFDDKDGSMMKKLAKEIDGRAESLDKLSTLTLIYQLDESTFNGDSISDHILSRIIAKDYM
ncbi:kinase binding protein [Dictyocaulus viviparus]|uniref:Kinase binding protein n=1 Tax=Dictyocaulus viviparus TaxID=29172 RepID=A0A0D8XXK0_DICVI|nr:kinase binding protein [Dictyocaulus viviparus]